MNTENLMIGIDALRWALRASAPLTAYGLAGEMGVSLYHAKSLLENLWELQLINRRKQISRHGSVMVYGHTLAEELAVALELADDPDAALLAVAQWLEIGIVAQSITRMIAISELGMEAPRATDEIVEGIHSAFADWCEAADACLEIVPELKSPTIDEWYTSIQDWLAPFS